MLNNDNKKTLRNLALYLGIPIILILIIAFAFGQGTQREVHKYSEILGYFQDQQVMEYNLNMGTGELMLRLKGAEAPPETEGQSEASGSGAAGGHTPGESGRESSAEGAPAEDREQGRKNGRIVNASVPDISLFFQDVREEIKAYNRAHPEHRMVQDIKPPSQNPWLMSLMPSLIMFALLIGFSFIFMRRLGSGMGGADKQMNFGKAKIKKMSDEKRKTTFADVAGADEEKAELQEIVEFLKNPSKFNSLGARIPKGVLLVGPPGTGKTLLARAVAGEAGVHFFSISGSDFVEMFVGVGASRVRDLFDNAKKNSPCIIFIDEIDAVGRQRGAGFGGGHDEREQTLNQLLVEMDGFGVNEGVIMIAATNRPDVLDPALMRPGRFDRQIMVGYPDVAGREAILKVHARGKPLAPDVDLKVIAKSTAGFTGADLENLLNEAALLSARKDLKAITESEIEEATIKVVMGTEKKSRVMTDKEKKLTAYHEGGHAIAAYYCKTQDPVHQISIIPRGMAGGYTMQLPAEDRSYRSRKEMKEELVVLLGGRLAESLALDDISTGASNDLERATKIARSMVTKYGMSDRLGPITYGSDESNPFLGKEMGHVSDYSEETAAEIDSEIFRIIETAYHRTEKILTDHMEQLHRVAKVLFEKEKIDGETFQKIMDFIPTSLEVELTPTPPKA